MICLRSALRSASCFLPSSVSCSVLWTSLPHALVLACVWALLLFLSGALWQPAVSLNLPCSGVKGGISHCDGEAFVCANGSVSASKQSCSTYSVSDRIVSSSNRATTMPSIESSSTREDNAADPEYASTTHMTKGAHKKTNVTVVPGEPSSATQPGNSNCPCTENSLCIGPRGGRFCLTRAGKKRYSKR